jgi:selenide,water dikinase
MKALLFDPQTSGGLLIAVAEDSAAELQKALISDGVDAVEIGNILPHTKPLISVTT